MMLRQREKNVTNENNNVGGKRQALKPVASKHKNVEKSDEPKAKRAALGDITKALQTYQIDSTKKKCTTATLKPNKEKVERLLPLQDVFEAEELEVDPCPEVDYDKENAHDPNAVSEFAGQIFKYLKWREPLFVPGEYHRVHRNVDLTARVVLVDWLIEIQEAFEMNHETLYMAVNLIDRYFTYCDKVHTEQLQLIACSAALIAAKVEERCAPLIDDLVYLCKDAFTPRQLKKMEQDMLATVGFDVCAPLSYSFLRRYGRVIKSDMALLTLARYILEVSIHFLSMSRVAPSRIAAAALLLALKMSRNQGWNKVLHKYSGYQQEDLEPLMYALNHMLCVYRERHPQCKMVFQKYEHEVFYEVAMTPTLQDKYAKNAKIAPPEDLMAAQDKAFASRQF